nr:ribosome silencing factor [Pasteuria penetrans]
MAQRVAQVAHNKKAQGVVILNVQRLATFTDYFVICHGQSVNQVQAIVRAIKESMLEEGVSIPRMEGYTGGRWVLLDLGDVVVHVFHHEEREFYHLERLWGDAGTVQLRES